MLSKTNTSLHAILLLVSLTLAGCADNHPAPTAIQIVPSIRTRVSGVHFETGDRIGLTILRGAEPYVQNQLMSYNGSAFAASELLWYNDLNEKSTLVAYHPYSASGAPTSFTVAADQSLGCASSDLLAAAKSDVTPVSTPVAMLFYHLLSQLTIVVTNQSDAAVTSVTLGGFVPTAEVDLAALEARVGSGVAADIQACEMTADANYRAILVPQQGTLVVSITTADGKRRSKTISEATLGSGKRYDLSVTVTNIDISLSLSGEIQDWDDGGEIGGDAGDDSGDVGGGNSLTYGGVTYATQSIGGEVWMTQNLRYQPAGGQIGLEIWYTAGGAADAPRLGLLYNYSTAKGADAARGGAPVRGICPAGWHLPDVAELTNLAAAQEVSAVMVGTGFRLDDGTYGDATRCYLMGATSSESGRCDVLCYSPNASPVFQVRSINANYGLSVRCVKD